MLVRQQAPLPAPSQLQAYAVAELKNSNNQTKRENIKKNVGYTILDK